MSGRINVFDQDTLDQLRDRGIDGELLARVRLTMQESADYHALYDDLPRVTTTYCGWCGEGKSTDHSACAIEYAERYGVALLPVA